MALVELVAVSRSLEDAFFELTEEAGMSALLQAELIKLRTTRTFVALAGVAVGTSLLITVLVALLTEPDRGRGARPTSSPPTPAACSS